MEDIRKLLRKRKMQGEPLGRALICKYVNAYHRAEDPTIPEYVSDEQFRKLESRFTDENEHRIYMFYQDMYFAIVEACKRRRENWNAAAFSLIYRMNVVATMELCAEVYAKYGEVPGQDDAPITFDLPAWTVLEPLRMVIGINTALEVLADVYGVPELATLVLDPAPIVGKIESYNRAVESIKHGLRNESNEPSERFKSGVEIINVDSIKVSPDKVEDLKKYLARDKHDRAAHNTVIYFTGMVEQLTEVQ